MNGEFVEAIHENETAVYDDDIDEFPRHSDLLLRPSISLPRLPFTSARLLHVSCLRPER